MDADRLASATEAIRTLPEAVGSLIDEERAKGFQLWSPAGKERIAFPEIAASAHDHGHFGIILSADYLFALERSMNPRETTTWAPWSLARNVLEATAISSWLLDPTIDGLTRISRSLSVRWREVRNEASLIRALPKEMIRESELEANKANAEEKIAHIGQVAEDLGIKPRLDKNGGLLGYGVALPGPTELADIIHGARWVYKLLSSVAHGDKWAIINVGFREVPDAQQPASSKFMEQYMPPVVAHFLRDQPLQWFIKPVWYKFQLYDWNLGKLTEMLDKECDKAMISEDARFWHRPETAPRTPSRLPVVR